MSFYGVEINALVNRLTLQIRLKLAQNKTGPNFRTLYRSFAQNDINITGNVSTQTFQKVLNQNGIFFKKFQYQGFEKAYGTNDGISWFRFLGHVREPMGPARRQVVQDIFNRLSGGNNQISLDTLSISLNSLGQKFNGLGSDSFQKVTKSTKVNFASFISLLATKQNSLSNEQFIAFYDDINVNFPGDEAFVRFVCTQWGVPPIKLESFNPQQIKQVLKSLRYKLIQKTQGTKDEFLLQKEFQEFDKNKNGSIGAYELDIMLKKLQLPVASKLIVPLLEKLDKNKSGLIEYQQFRRFVFFDPFPQ